jgi:hypothetical protein
MCDSFKPFLPVFGPILEILAKKNRRDGLQFAVIALSYNKGSVSVGPGVILIRVCLCLCSAIYISWKSGLHYINNLSYFFSFWWEICGDHLLGEAHSCKIRRKKISCLPFNEIKKCFLLLLFWQVNFVPYNTSVNSIYFLKNGKTTTLYTANFQ